MAPALLGQMHMEPSAPCPAHDENSSGGTDAPAGPQRSWFLRQMELDTAFLRELNMTDYSLLVAFQQLHEDEKGLGSSLIFRTVRWAPDRNEVMRAWKTQMVRWGDSIGKGWETGKCVFACVCVCVCVGGW